MQYEYIYEFFTSTFLWMTLLVVKYYFIAIKLCYLSWIKENSINYVFLQQAAGNKVPKKMFQRPSESLESHCSKPL